MIHDQAKAAVRPNLTASPGLTSQGAGFDSLVGQKLAAQQRSTRARHTRLYGRQPYPGSQPVLAACYSFFSISWESTNQKGGGRAVLVRARTTEAS